MVFNLIRARENVFSGWAGLGSMVEKSVNGSETIGFPFLFIYPLSGIFWVLLPAKKFVYSFYPVGYMELFVDVINMFTNCFRAYKKLCANFFIHQSL